MKKVEVPCCILLLFLKKINVMEKQDSKKVNTPYLLFEGDQRLRTLVENLPGIVYRCKNDKDRTMQFISNECKWVTGYSPEQFCYPEGITWRSIIHPLDRDHVWNTLQEAIGKKEKFHFKYRVLDSGDKVHWISETGIAVEKREGTAYLEGYMQDITAQITGGNMDMIRDRALDEVSNGIVISNAQLKEFPIIYVNKAFERITGYTQDEVIGKNCNFLQSDDRQQKEIKIILKALLSKSPCRVEIRNYRKDGAMFWNELSITPVRDTKGETTHFIGVQNDITQRKNLELLRKAKNDVLEMIIKKAPLNYILHRIQGVLEEQFRIGKVFFLVQDTKEKKTDRISGEKPWSPLVKTMDAILAEPGSSPGLRAIQSKKKEIVTGISKELSWSGHRDVLEEAGILSHCSYPLLDSENQILGAMCIFFTDVFHQDPERESLLGEMGNLASMAIEQHRIREKLKKNHEQLEAYSKNLEKQVKRRNKDLKKTLKELNMSNFELLTQIAETKASKKRAEIQEAILLAIAQNFPKGAILLVDKNMHINFMKGTELKLLQGRVNSKKITSIDDLDGFSTKDKSLLQHHTDQALKGKHLSFEIEHQKNSYAVNTSPLLRENGKVSLALLVMFNISERKQNEKIIFETLKKEKELSDLKSQFISTASHEFRTPLSVILSSASLIERLNDTDKSERRLFHLERIKSNVQHLVNLLNDFLSLTKLEEGETKAVYEHFDLLQLAKSLIGEIQEIKKKGQTIELEYSGAEMDIHLDPKLMRHILLNLLNNAIKYSDEGQTIFIKVEEGFQTIQIQVIDEGIGIPEDDKPYIFRRFFRAKNSINVPGTGLGLNIIKSYTELMGGKLRYESKENQGSSFELEFPKSTIRNEKSTDY